MSTIMDDSCQDFEDACSKLLKRVRKKQDEPRQQRKEEKQPSSQASDGAKRNFKKPCNSGSRGTIAEPFCAAVEADLEVVGGGPAFKSGDADKAEGQFTAKDKVLQRMQKFKRASPQKIVHWDNIQTLDGDCAAPPTLMKQNASPPESVGSNSPVEPEDGDEALAKQLQQELNREVMQAQGADLMDRGLFYCHICHKELTHMTPEGRTQHVNRCLDESEGSASVPPPPPPPLPLSSAVPDCPICGKRFKSLKSHSAHLKRCSSDMGVSPAQLLQALHRQAEERQNALSANTLTETVGTKRKGSSRPGLPAKKPRKKAEVLDEKTMVALALSSSLYEQERLSERAAQTDTTSEMWISHTGKGRGKKKKGGVPRPPSLLLVQDAAAALNRLQERVSALLLRDRPTSPPTPTRCPSTVPGWSGAAPLWQKSSLLEGLSSHQSDLYTHELRGFFTLSEKDQVPSSINKSVSSDCPAKGGSVVTTENSTLPPSQTDASSMATEELPVSTQVFRDLMELAEDGMVLSQGSHSASCCDGDDVNISLRASGFVQEELEDQADLCTSGFLPQEMAFSRLRSDLDGMVNNPQLSDVQLQVDTGEVYFAHSFMLYTRCPLLAEMVHENGFGVREEGMPSAQRVLITDVPAQAVFALLQYLYTANVVIPSSLRLHVLELASRFDLKQLKQLCELTQKQATNQGHEEDAKQGCEDDAVSWEDAESQKDQAFLDLLRSMWNEEVEDNEAGDADERQDEEKAGEEENGLSAVDGEVCEEKVNEEELEEIYEFAATQRKRTEEGGSTHEQQETENGDRDFTKLAQPERSTCQHLNNTNANAALWSDPSPDRSSLSSEPLGDCDQGDVLSSCSAQNPQTPETKWCHKFPTKQSATGRTLLQSSASVVGDLSPGGPPVRSFLPVPGETPDQQRNCDPEERLIPKQEDRGPHRLSIDLSPDRLQDKQEPELIVLSDSNSPSPNCSPPPENLESYTRITPHPREARTGRERPGSVECSQDYPVDCSPELSWLIPSTPLQRSRNTSSSSATQTRSSMWRTQLFPHRDAPAPGSSPPDGNATNHSHPSGGVSQAFAHNGSVEGDVERTLPHSSTPLHPDVHQPHIGLCTPPNNRSFDRQRLKSKGNTKKPCERMELGTFQSSPLSDPSGSPSSCLHKGFHGSQRDADRPYQSQRSAQWCKSVLLERDMPQNGAIHEREGGNKGTFDEQPHEEAAPSDSHQSFMDLDEPPIAFNDSWGLNMCTDAHAGCFSLRLEDSGACSQQEPLHTHRDAPTSTSDTGLTPPSHGLSPCPSQVHHSQPQNNIQPQTHSSPQGSIGRPPPQLGTSLLDSHVWDSWEEEEDEVLPLSQRANPPAGLKTPVACCQQRQRSLVAITPMPHYSDMDTPELKNKLTRFGVRPLPKCQMILKLKEIHRYTHQLLSSDSEDEGRPVSHAAQIKPSSVSAGDGQHPCAQPLKFQAPGIPPPTSPLKDSREEQIELLSASQGSNTSSTAASEESERSNPELVPSSDGDSDSDNSVPASQAASRLQERLQAVRDFILSDSELYTQILEYRPLVLSQFQGRLKAAGIRLGISRLAEYLDSQCITFTTAKPGQPAACRGRGKRVGRRPVLVGESGPSRKKGVPATG